MLLIPYLQERQLLLATLEPFVYNQNHENKKTTKTLKTCIVCLGNICKGSKVPFLQKVLDILKFVLNSSKNLTVILPPPNWI